MLSKKDIAIKENILKPNTVETFFKHVEVTDDCHIWQGPKLNKGYGLFTVYSPQATIKKATRVLAHRFAYALAYGFEALPVGIQKGERNVINHLCHNKVCINPKHLEVITQAENLSLKKRKPIDGAA